MYYFCLSFGALFASNSQHPLFYFYSCLVLQLNFVSTWGDPYYLGLTGLEVLGPNSERIPLSYNMLTVGAIFACSFWTVQLNYCWLWSLCFKCSLCLLFSQRHVQRISMIFQSTKTMTEPLTSECYFGCVLSFKKDGGGSNELEFSDGKIIVSVHSAHLPGIFLVLTYSIAVLCETTTWSDQFGSCPVEDLSKYSFTPV